MFAKRKKREAAALAQSADAHVAQLQAFLEEARTFDGAPASDIPDMHVQLRAGESAFMCVQGAFLIEPRRAAGQWQGRSQGVSVHIPGTRSMRYRVGATRGQYVQGAERPTPIDQGEFTITNKRAIFVGPTQTREWLWSKLVGIEHASESPWTSISVSNRQKTSGVLYDLDHEDQIRFRIDLAVAVASGTREDLVQEIVAEVAAAQASLPRPPDA
jgi:hypothetical protein